VINIILDIRLELKGQFSMLANVKMTVYESSFFVVEILGHAMHSPCPQNAFQTA
jgi:hypothetical protein